MAFWFFRFILVLYSAVMDWYFNMCLVTATQKASFLCTFKYTLFFNWWWLFELSHMRFCWCFAQERLNAKNDLMPVWTSVNIYDMGGVSAVVGYFTGYTVWVSDYISCLCLCCLWMVFHPGEEPLSERVHSFFSSCSILFSTVRLWMVLILGLWQALLLLNYIICQ